MSVQRCAECTCEHGGDDCNWIMSAADRAATREAELQAEIARLRSEFIADRKSSASAFEAAFAAREAAAYAAGLEAAAEWHDEEHDAEEMTADGYGEVGRLIKARLHGLMAAHHFHSAVALRKMKNFPADAQEKPQKAPTSPEASWVAGDPEIAAPGRHSGATAPNATTRALDAFNARPCDAQDARLPHKDRP